MTRKFINTTLCAAILSTGSLFAKGDWDTFYKSVAKDLRSKDVAQVNAAVEQFSDQDYEEAGLFLVKLMIRSSTDPGVAATISEILGGFENKDVKKKIKAAIKNKPDGNFYLLKTYLQQVTDENEKVKVCSQILKTSRKSNCVTIAIEGLENAKIPDSAIKLLASKLSPKQYHSVRRAAAKTLGTLGSTIPVPQLISQVKDHVTGEASRLSLFKITGKNFGKHANLWTKWWETNKAKPAPTPKTEAEVAQHQKEASEKEAKQVSSFYGKPLEGKNILFLLDKSGSMKGARIETLKTELVQMIGKMGQERSFGFVMFPLDSFPKKGISQAKPSYKKRAIKFAKNIQVTGATPISDAVEHAFEKVVQRNNIDTIYLLSDGAPTKPAAEVRKYISKMNAGLYVKINCVSIGSDSQFLKDVAKDHGGDYWSVR